MPACLSSNQRILARLLEVTLMRQAITEPSHVSTFHLVLSSPIAYFRDVYTVVGMIAVEVTCRRVAPELI
jgi:hypothetical protein